MHALEAVAELCIGMVIKWIKVLADRAGKENGILSIKSDKFHYTNIWWRKCDAYLRNDG